MQDFFDYLYWRGDLSFSASPLNDIDALIFTQLVYLNFNGLISDSFDEKIKLSQLAEKFKNSKDFETRKNLGMVINPKCVNLLFECGKTERFGNTEVSAYSFKYSLKAEEQFCAMTFSQGDMKFVSFRGTDDTVVGWKEDFNLAFMEKVPSQEDALEYLKSAIQKAETKISIGGHSKGGNLAIFSAAKLSADEQDKISAIYNFDGPGFSKEVLASKEFTNIEEKTKSFYPQFSMIGMLFHHFKKYTVVKSEQKFVFQHDPFSWFLKVRDFETKKSLDHGSQSFYKIFNSWFEKLSEDKRIEFVETLFGVLESSGAENFSDLVENWKDSTVRILKAISEMDKTIRKSALHTVKLLITSAGENIHPIHFDSEN